jgi:hypothetical protein
MTRDIIFNFPIVNFPFICSKIPAAPTYDQIFNMTNMTGANNGAGTAYPSVAPEFYWGLSCSVFNFV